MSAMRAARLLHVAPLMTGRPLMLRAAPAACLRGASAPALRVVGMRHSSSSAANPNVRKVVRSVSNALNTYGPSVATAMGGLVVVYGVSSLAITITGSFLSLSLTDAVKFGFATGFASAGLMAAVGLRAYRRITIRPEAVYQAALYKLGADARVAAAMGATLRPGALRAYNLVPGHLSTQKMGWVDPRIQMLFQVVGTDTGREGIATVEAIKHNGALKFNLVALDLLAQSGGKPQLLLVAGKEEKLAVRGQLRGFLQSERAQYIAQDVAESDEQLMKEQELADADKNDEAAAAGVKA